ncbi:hypothetical protein AMQ83_35585 [Paenibacillus riograndensis]|nr:hypothetical protein AMQ83_35585 [Paenibacillus riograndensis]
MHMIRWPAIGNVMKMFTEYNRSLDESGLSRFSTFINYSKANLCVGDAEILPIGSSCCNIKSFYDEVFRVLKPGGIFIYTDDLPTRKFDDGERYYLELGFELLISRDISGEVLLSNDQVQMNSLATTIWHTKGVPGTLLYDEMKSGERKYKTMHFRKQAHHDE